MNCNQLAHLIEDIQPDASPRDVARLCLLLANDTDELERLGDSDNLMKAWNEVGMKLQAATDQHAAMTMELDELAHSDPEKFTRDQIWILVRAIKVQSQVLQMYVGSGIEV